MTKKELGQQSEELAAEFLVGQGYKIIARNLNLKVGEIDILAQDQDVVVIVEVKSRIVPSFEPQNLHPIYNITPIKQRKLRLLAAAISARYPNHNLRIDGITVCWCNREDLKPRLSHWLNILN